MESGFWSVQTTSSLAKHQPPSQPSAVRFQPTSCLSVYIYKYILFIYLLLLGGFSAVMLFISLKLFKPLVFLKKLDVKTGCALYSYKHRVTRRPTSRPHFYTREDAPHARL